MFIFIKVFSFVGQEFVSETLGGGPLRAPITLEFTPADFVNWSVLSAGRHCSIMGPLSVK